jgi:hypothetical protein
MITVIICSVKPELREDVTTNIAATIGVEYELIVKDNRNTQMGICAVYNEAAAQARFPYLCFVHEDVCFQTFGWGRKLIDLLLNPNNALIGVSGAVYKSAVPGSWVDCDKSYYRTSAIQHFKDGSSTQQIYNPDNEIVSKVSVVDGVFLAMTAMVWTTTRFDDQMFKGFHCYDLDISLQCSLIGDVIVSNEIILEHFSSGTFNETWLIDTMKFHKKWKDILPNKNGKKNSHEKFSDYISTASFLNHLLKFKGKKKIVICYFAKIVFLYFFYNNFRFTKSVYNYLRNS